MSSRQSTPAGTMNALRGKLHFPIILICSIALISLIIFSNPFFKHKSCSRRTASVMKKHDRNDTVEKIDASVVDDRFVFDPEECSVEHGKWVFNRSIKPFYSDRSCPYLDRQVSCVKNGRPDSDYRHWEWQPEDCTLPR